MFFIDKSPTGFVPTKNDPKIAFSLGETGVSWSKNCIFCSGGGGGLLVVGPKVAFFHIMRYY